MISNFRDVIVLVLFFSFTIFVHELGHFLVARKLGFFVDTFSIGFGPAIWKKKVGDVTYKICWLPLGGYVSLPQLDPLGMDTIQGKSDDSEKQKEKEEIYTKWKDLPKISAWKKILVLIAGVTGNVIFAFFLANIIYFSPKAITGEVGPVTVAVDNDSQAHELGIRSGDKIVAVDGKVVDAWFKVNTEAMAKPAGETLNLQVASKSGEVKEYVLKLEENHVGFTHIPGVDELLPPFRIKDVVKGSTADQGGMEPGDIPRSLNGTPVTSADEFVNLVIANKGKESVVLVEREGKMVEVPVTPVFDEKHSVVRVGVTLDYGGIMPWMHYKNPFRQIKEDALMIFRVLKGLLDRDEQKQMGKGIGGPVRIFQALWLAMQISYLNALGFLRMLNINLAILNLLPIPLLDGGHIIFSLWEGLTKKRIHPKVVNVLVNVFGILLIGLMLLITCKDIVEIAMDKFGFRKAKREAAEAAEKEKQAPAKSATNAPAAPVTE